MAGLTSLARDASALLDPEAEKRPNGGISLGRPQTAELEEVSLYHRVGRLLLASAAHAGRYKTATAAAEVFRMVMEKAPDDPSLHNGLGAALMECARLESEAVALASLREAMQAFQAASALVSQQVAPPAARLRYQTNLATVLWMLGERTNNADDARKSVEILREVSSELTDSSPHWTHVQDNLGNALMTLGQADDAIDAYETALVSQRVSLDRGRSLSNLGTAYASQGRFVEACRSYRQALICQPPDQAPLAWARTQHNLGSALLQEAVERKRPRLVGKQLRQAIEAFEAAREPRRCLGSLFDWGITTANLASAHIGIGVHDYTQAVRPDRRAGADHVRRGIALYKEALPELAAADQNKTFENIAVALQILEKISDGGREADELRDHRVALVSLAAQYGQRALFDTVPIEPFEPDLVGKAPKVRWSAAAATLSVGLAWPTETYAQAHKMRRENIVEFLTRVWLPFIKAGAVDLRLLRETDPSAAKGLDNFTQKIDPATGQRRRLPPHLQIPTKKELNDRLAESLPSPGDRPARLDWALRARARRMKSK
jgi:tetratricopeptide (TPR) repeat protein